MKRIAAVTIGQAPRTDVMAELRSLLPAGIDVVEAGALDGLDRQEIERLTRNENGPILVTRLKDGSEVKVPERFVAPRLRDCVQGLDGRADLILVLCTGTLGRIDCRTLTLFPELILSNLVRSLGVRRAGVLTPAAEQSGCQLERWLRIVPEVFVESASPYGAGEDLGRAALKLSLEKPDILVMDCIGYTLAMKEKAQSVARRPVLLARSVLARIAAEVLG